MSLRPLRLVLMLCTLRTWSSELLVGYRRQLRSISCGGLIAPEGVSFLDWWWLIEFDWRPKTICPFLICILHCKALYLSSLTFLIRNVLVAVLNRRHIAVSHESSKYNSINDYIVPELRAEGHCEHAHTNPCHWNQSSYSVRKLRLLYIGQGHSKI